MLPVRKAAVRGRLESPAERCGTTMAPKPFASRSGPRVFSRFARPLAMNAALLLALCLPEEARADPFARCLQVLRESKPGRRITAET